ncbi:MAG: hypothetical protein HC822_25240 [Oscillochloris sp.]|nr:hypothetical protein [Oscillochloris sp.]
MHDGYLFILGICGSSSGSGPAPAVLDAALAAVPPVKRAAYFGEVLVSDGAPNLVDPLVNPVIADIADAEVLVIVTPLPGGRLPPALGRLAGASLATPAQGRRFIVFVAFGDDSADPFRRLRMNLHNSGAQIVGEIQAPYDCPAEVVIPQVIGLIRQAYQCARTEHPEALPQ